MESNLEHIDLSGVVGNIIKYELYLGKSDLIHCFMNQDTFELFTSMDEYIIKRSNVKPSEYTMLGKKIGICSDLKFGEVDVRIIERL